VIDVHRLHLTDVTPAPNLPWTRPTFPVFAYLVLHPTGPILIDTGVGIGNAFIDELYSPVHHDLDEALDRHGVSTGDIATVITSHLHFDHCGQNESSLFVKRLFCPSSRSPAGSFVVHSGGSS
jgi:glyoxylase-like metal-dependent hydrolase (beta-lactamase superfamily II)